MGTLPSSTQEDIEASVSLKIRDNGLGILGIQNSTSAIHEAS